MVTAGRTSGQGPAGGDTATLLHDNASMTASTGASETGPGRIARWPSYVVYCYGCRHSVDTVTVRAPVNRPPVRHCEAGHEVDTTGSWYETVPGESPDFEIES